MVFKSRHSLDQGPHLTCSPYPPYTDCNFDNSSCSSVIILKELLLKIIFYFLRSKNLSSEYEILKLRIPYSYHNYLCYSV